jgi:radical SAM protein with 4Fe4S-binding SPASM domain
LGLHIDLNVTSICNLACTYCSEGNECGLSSLYLKNTNVKVEDIINKILKQPGEKQINFWGGEPLVNWNYCTAVMDGLKDNKDVGFFYYTNGVLIKDHIDEIKKYAQELGPKRFKMQISYDGEYLTNNIRIDKSGNGTADRVIEGYNILKENGIETSLKSVISAEGFPHLFDSYLTVSKVQGYYNPTPDLYSDLNFDEFQESLEILGEQLQLIMKHIYDNNLKPETFSWFRLSKAICSVGDNIVGVDLTGDLYPCHGCFYEGRDEYKIGTFEDLETDKLDKVREKFKMLNQHKPFECQSCNVNFCMKCQAANLSKSDKPTFEEKWTDYQSNWQVCQLFKFVDKYNKTIRYAMHEKGII